MIYQIMLLLHIMGVILFFGNLMIAFFLMYRLESGSNPEVAFHDLKTVNKADKWLTGISVILILSSGIYLSNLMALRIFDTGWIFWSLTAWGISGTLFLVKVLPLQIKLQKLSEKLIDHPGFEIKNEFSKVLGQWKKWSFPASFFVFLALLLMVFKPIL